MGTMGGVRIIVLTVANSLFHHASIAHFWATAMAKSSAPLEGDALIKEVCRRIRVARQYWDAHKNAACRGEREKALALYTQLSQEQRAKIPQALRVWLRYRSEKYFGSHRTPPKTKGRSGRGHPRRPQP